MSATRDTSLEADNNDNLLVVQQYQLTKVLISYQLTNIFLVWCWGALLPSSGLVTIWCEITAKLRMIARVANTFESLAISQGGLSKNLTSANSKRWFINFSGQVYYPLWRAMKNITSQLIEWYSNNNIQISLVAVEEDLFNECKTECR